MKRTGRVLLSAILGSALIVTGFAQDASVGVSSSTAKGAPVSLTQSKSDVDWNQIYRSLNVTPGYRYATTTGFVGRAAEYDNLRRSAGGDLAFTRIDPKAGSSFKYQGGYVNRDDYDMKAEARLGQWLCLKMHGGSFVRNIDRVGFGTNVDDPANGGDLLRTDEIAPGTQLGVARSQANLDARLKVPKTPVTFFVRTDWQERRGNTQLQFMDMGSSPQGVGCAACHASSKFQTVNNSITDVHAGMELKLLGAMLTYEHRYREFSNKMRAPVDAYGFSADDGAHPGPPYVPNVDYYPTPTTLDGNYAHNVLPNSRLDSDSVRLRVPVTDDVTFNGGATAGRSSNLYAGNLQKNFSSDGTVNWRAHKRLRVTADAHQDYSLNDFTPLYPLYANPNLRRWKAGARADYRLTDSTDLDVRYRRSEIARSGAGNVPSFYSFDSRILTGTPADAFVPRRIARTASNIAGSTVKWRYGEKGNIRGGYEWTGTHAPGYLTDPDNSHRFSLGADYAPKEWLMLSNDGSVTLDKRTGGVGRSAQLYTDTAYLTFTRVKDLAVSLGYAFSESDVRTNLTYTADPLFLPSPYFFQEAGVPFSATSHVFSLSCRYLLQENLTWKANLQDAISYSSFQTNLGGTSCQGFPCGQSVSSTASFSSVRVSQPSISTGLDYRSRDYNCGVAYQYAAYTDLIHQELNGHYQIVSMSAGRTW